MDRSVPAPSRNIEIKAHAASLEAARRVCQTLTPSSSDEHQIDTYFRCQQGRLKLRERIGAAAQLVAYARVNAVEPRASDYHLVPAPDAALLKAALAATLGVLVVVEKQREVFLYRNVRIHLDQVTGLGTFVELEAVVSAATDEAASTSLVQELCGRMSIASSDLVDCSYSDLLLVKQAAGS